MDKGMVCLFVVLASFASPSAYAASPKAKKLNTQLYEQDSAGTSASGKVKVVREVQEETEVFLDVKSGSSGPFILPQSAKNRAALMKMLTSSQKAGGSPVTLQLDDQQRILNVEESAGASKSDSGGSTSAEKWGL